MATTVVTRTRDTPTTPKLYFILAYTATGLVEHVCETLEAAHRLMFDLQREHKYYEIEIEEREDTNE